MAPFHSGYVLPSVLSHWPAAPLSPCLWTPLTPTLRAGGPPEARLAAFVLHQRGLPCTLEMAQDHLVDRVPRLHVLELLRYQGSVSPACAAPRMHPA